MCLTGKQSTSPQGEFWGNMRTKLIRLFKIDELSPEVREEVVNKHRDMNVHDEWWDFILEGFCERLHEDGINLSAKDISFDFGRYRKIAIEKAEVHDRRAKLLFKVLDKKLKAKILNRALDDEVPYIYLIIKKNAVETAEYDEDKLSEDEVEEIEGAVNCYLDEKTKELLKKLEEHYDYLISDEAIIETMRSNEWEFTEGGLQWIPVWRKGNGIRQSGSLVSSFGRRGTAESTT